MPATQRPTKIPATVITGFLGAGKTSLVRHLVATSGRRLALVINEFGELGVDRELLLGCGIEGCGEDDVVELANGCLCCTVADDFLPTMRLLLAREPTPEHIVIETSGLALPKPLVKAFAWPEVRARVTVDGVIAVVDAEAAASGRLAADLALLARQRALDPALDHDSPLAELFEEQLGCADLVVLNKIDLVDDEARSRAGAAIVRHLRPGARVVAARHGELDPRVLLGLGAAAEGDPREPPFAARGRRRARPRRFRELLGRGSSRSARPKHCSSGSPAAARRHPILRVKGFVAVDGRAARHIVQAVGPRVQGHYDRPWSPGEPRRGELVVIGLSGLDRTAIAADLRG